MECLILMWNIDSGHLLSVSLIDANIEKGELKS